MDDTNLDHLQVNDINSGHFYSPLDGWKKLDFRWESNPERQCRTPTFWPADHRTSRWCDTFYIYQLSLSVISANKFMTRFWATFKSVTEIRATFTVELYNERKIMHPSGLEHWLPYYQSDHHTVIPIIRDSLNKYFIRFHAILYCWNVNYKYFRLITDN